MADWHITGGGDAIQRLIYIDEFVSGDTIYVDDTEPTIYDPIENFKQFTYNEDGSVASEYYKGFTLIGVNGPDICIIDAEGKGNDERVYSEQANINMHQFNVKYIDTDGTEVHDCRCVHNGKISIVANDTTATGVIIIQGFTLRNGHITSYIDTCADEDGNPLLDENGNPLANSDGIPLRRWNGLVCGAVTFGVVQLISCTIYNCNLLAVNYNRAGCTAFCANGAGVYYPHKHCIFRNNEAWIGYAGGYARSGMYANGVMSNTALNNCLIVKNKFYMGYNYSTFCNNALINNCTIWDNDVICSYKLQNLNDTSHANYQKYSLTFGQRFGSSNLQNTPAPLWSSNNISQFGFYVVENFKPIFYRNNYFKTIIDTDPDTGEEVIIDSIKKFSYFCSRKFKNNTKENAYGSEYSEDACIEYDTIFGDDPMFDENYRLLPNSPCAGTGYRPHICESLDISGNKWNYPQDRGAYSTYDQSKILTVPYDIPTIDNTKNNLYIDINATGNNTGEDWENALTSIPYLDKKYTNYNVYIKPGKYVSTNTAVLYINAGGIHIYGYGDPSEIIIDGENTRFCYRNIYNYTYISVDNDVVDPNATHVIGLTLTRGYSDNGFGGADDTVKNATYFKSCIFTGFENVNDKNQYFAQVSQMDTCLCYKNNSYGICTDGDSNGTNYLNRNKIINCIFRENNAPINSSFDTTNKYVDFIDCEIINNMSSVEPTARKSNFNNIINCKFTANINTGEKGGSLIIINGTALDNCEFRENLTLYKTGKGGAIYITNFNTKISNCKFYDNYAQNGFGGAVNSQTAHPELYNCEFYNNYAFEGGALRNCCVYYSIFKDNFAKYSQSHTSYCTVDHCDISGGKCQSLMYERGYVCGQGTTRFSIIHDVVCTVYGSCLLNAANNCIIYNNRMGSCNKETRRGGCFYGLNALVYNNLVYNNYFSCYLIGRTKSTNNVFINNEIDYSMINFPNDSKVDIIANNIFKDNKFMKYSSVNAEQGTGEEYPGLINIGANGIVCNNIFNNTPIISTTSPVSNNLFEQIIDLTTEFKPTKDSIVVGFGNREYLQTNKDLDDEFWNKNPSVGCYEYKLRNKIPNSLYPIGESVNIN